MELAISVLTVFYTHLRMNYLDILFQLAKALLRFIFFLLSLVIIPVVRIRARNKRPKLPPIKNEILLLSATELSRKIRRRELSCEEAISAYIARCKEVNPALNAIVEDRYEKAINEARQIDALLKASTKTEEELARSVPLLGVPVTIKESIAVEGMSHSVGVKMERPLRASEDADVVKRIRKAGAIPLLVSNTPELCMWWESYNNVTGTTFNPYNTTRTAGGSSGGEAALLGSGASLLGLTSDIAGSTRLPAMFCGVFGHKPSPGWVSTKGHRPDCPDKNWPMLFTLGAMTRYAEDLPLLLKVIMQVDGVAHRLNEQISLRDIKFFYMEDNGGCTGSAPVSREIKSAIHKLIKYIEIVHEVKVQKANFNMKTCLEVAGGMLLCLDNVESIYAKESNPQEWRSVTMEVLKYICRKSFHTLPLICYGISKRVAALFPRSHYAKMEKKNTALKQQFKEVLGDNGVLIYPSFTNVAHYPHEMLYKVCSTSYTMAFNVLGLPVTQCPMGFNSEGLPIGLQIVANPGCDSLSLAVAREIQMAFGGWQQVPANTKTV